MAGKLTEAQAMEAAFKALKELPKEDLPRVFAWLSSKLGMGSLPNSPDSSPSPAVSGAAIVNQTGTITPKTFLAAKKPDTDAEKVACLSYFLTFYRNTTQFKNLDITSLNTEAAQRPFTNTSVAVDNATYGSGYLAPIRDGQKQITARGEALVNALPDRKKVEAALSEHPIRSRKKKRRAKAAKAK